jgi:hypothetical protein
VTLRQAAAWPATWMARGIGLLRLWIADVSRRDLVHRNNMFVPHNDQELTRWLNEHPSGYVLHTRRDGNPSVVVLHRASCAMIRPKQGLARGAATQRDYRKVCADEVSELEEWVGRRGRISFSRRCGRCRP